MSEYRGPIAWMARNSVAANLLMLALMIGGVFFIGKTKQEVFPQFELDLVLISVPYPGASPEEVEQGVVLAIEEAVRGVDGVKELRSTAGEGLGQSRSSFSPASMPRIPLPTSKAPLIES